MDSPYNESTHFAPDINNSERLTTPELNGLLNAVANHEAKLLTLLVLATNPEFSFTESTLRKQMAASQGDQPGWIQNNAIPAKYCRDSLEPIGAVVKGLTDGKKGLVTAYQISDFGQKWGVPLAGLLLDWSLKYPDLSLQQVFGKTGSSTDHRSPELRCAIYQEILTNPGTEPVSMTSIWRSLGEDEASRSLIESQIRALRNLGIVEVDSTLENYNPTISITRSEFEHVALDFEDLKYETQLIYKALGELTPTGDLCTLDEILRSVETIDPNVDLSTVRGILVNAASSKTTVLPNLEFMGHDTSTNRTVVKLSDKVQSAVSELLEEIAKLSDSSNLEKYRQKAFVIAQDPNLFAKLMQKAKRFSPASAGQLEGSEGLNNRIKTIIGQNENLTAAEITELLAEAGRSLDKSTVKLALGRMTVSGELQMKKVIPDKSKRVVVRSYSLAESSTTAS